MRRAWLLAGMLTALSPALAGAALAKSDSPYEMTYEARVDTTLRAAIEAGSPAVAQLPKGSGGIVLRWCRAEIPFGKWQFGSPAVWRALLDERACEVGWNGRVGFVDGTAITPER